MIIKIDNMSFIVNTQGNFILRENAPGPLHFSEILSGEVLRIIRDPFDIIANSYTNNLSLELKEYNKYYKKILKHLCLL